MYQNRGIFSLFALCYGLVAGRIERTPVNGAVVCVAFGAIFGPIGFGLLNLTVVRKLPIYVSLTGLGMRTDAKLFVGWFGPRGLASIVFLVMVANANPPGDDTMVATVMAAVVLSIVARGLGANPLVARFGARTRPAEPTDN